MAHVQQLHESVYDALRFSIATHAVSYALTLFRIA